MTGAGRRGRILVVDDEARIRAIVSAVLRDEGYEVRDARDAAEALGLVKEFAPHLAVVDLQMPRVDGLETIARLKEERPGLVAIILTAHGSITSAVQAMKQGIHDYLTKPFDNEQLLLTVRRGMQLAELSEEVDQLKSALGRVEGLQRLLGESPAIVELRAQVKKIAETDATVLIEGESGTGKEVTARAIHYESRRKAGPLLVVDCTSVPRSLMESEFFGHERGAFTDAREQRRGRLEEADGGTLFLDEIGELPLEAQAKLLRFLQEREFVRVGGTVPVKVDVRVIAATNKNLEEEARQGRFREDLYYRLNVLKLRTPSLREHAEDIPIYAAHFLEKHRAGIGRRLERLSEEAVRTLSMREWRGNIRELENAIQRAMLQASGPIIEERDLEPLLTPRPGKGEAAPGEGLEAYVRSLTVQAERRAILAVLEATGWNRTEAAEKLRISRKTLFNKMQEYGIEEEGSDL